MISRSLVSSCLVYTLGFEYALVKYNVRLLVVISLKAFVHLILQGVKSHAF